MTEEINKKEPVFVKVNRKFIRDLAKFGNVYASVGDVRFYSLSQVFVKNDSLPIGVYQVVELKDLPEHILTGLGLQKIPANEKV